MSTGLKWNKLGYASLLSVAILCCALVTVAGAQTATPHRVKAKAKAKKPELPPLPSGPTGPVQPMPLDTIGAVPPQVTFQNNELTIVAPNSTLADILRAVRKSTGAEIEVPSAPERVVTHLGPGPARSIVAQLLNGSRFNYVLLGSPQDETALTRVVLVAKSGADTIVPNPAAQAPQPGVAQANPVPQPEAQETPPPDVNDAEQPPAEDNTAGDENAEQPPAETADQQGDPNQPPVKTPQQMLQEMQQRQMQLQMQQPQGQQPVPGSGMPPHPPQEQ